MEERFVHPVPTPNSDDTLEIVRSLRDAPPAHYTLKIESFSQFSEILRKTKVESYESGVFEAGGYKWKLVLYPYGNKKRNGNAHISLYLAMTETNSLPPGWEVNVILKFLVFDQIRDKYLTVHDGRIRRFHDLKTEWGFPQFLPLSTFNEVSNGYLVDDCCAFGAEVFVVNSRGKGETFLVLKEPENRTYTWKIERFSTINEERYYSDVFTVCQHQWKLLLYPKGDSRAKDTSLSLFLENSTIPRRKLYTEYKLSVKNQVNANHSECTGNSWFCDSEFSWGFREFMSLKVLNDTSKGFIVNDTLIVQLEINLISMIKNVL